MQNLKNKKQKVFVGLSGGVDSAVSLLLLKNAKNGNGDFLYDVTGVFIKTWTPEYIECSQIEDRRDAMRVCAILEIPFITLDLEKEYKKYVIDYFLKEYKNNRVPNPDVMCNKYIKFDAFYNFAKKHNAKIATGHYTRLKTQDARAETERKEYFLVKAKDKSKDQVYFLYQINKNILKDIIFPLADLNKNEVKKIAEKNNLDFLNKKKESMGICMLGGNISPKEFLKIELKPKKGKVINSKGETVGEHDGVILYTLGERHGFKVFNKNNIEASHYIIKKDIKKNILVVSNKNSDLSQIASKRRMETQNTKIILSDLNFFISEEKIKNFIKQEKVSDFQYRYHGELVKGRINGLDKNKKELKVLLEKDLQIQAGQSMVFYMGEILLGGGIIK